ncbi:uncharacterized protein LOC21392262 isoform X2 [Morus notabilis]|uniref:uncharacterized protein LOC21392262 isoform X2 n=1 Tax=Morus notabilis TaxID=981085 RepID=UPI000CED501A|nr:uncharacterized protein LOC21392262 isoform X2 [Morus notabilis]
MNQGFWMTKGSGCVNDGEMTYDNSSRIEQKRSYQWFADGPEVELFPNKKQAVVEVPNNNPFPGMLSSNASPWGTAPNFPPYPGHVAERLFESEAARNVGFDERNVSSIPAEKMNVVRKVNEDPYGKNSSFGLSVSNVLEDPSRSGLTYGLGFRKVKVSEVKDTENLMSVSMGQAYSKGNDNTLSISHSYNKLGENSLSILGGDTFERTDNGFISMGQPFIKGDGSISIDQTFKENNHTISADQTFSKSVNGSISTTSSLVYGKVQESTVLPSHALNKGDDNVTSIGHSYNKGESTIISFGGCDDDYGDDANALERLMSTYEMLMGKTSVLKTEEVIEKELVNSLNADALVNASPHVTSASTKSFCKKKDDHKVSKKASPNTFPPNVRSLLSTGMLDGVPVKYISWSREELRAVIKGTGYLCGCQSCNYSKVVNAFEFEHHACCKTKHPNNHIYFDNGKTIYGIVQELRSTPQHMLFDVLQTITGSPINQKSFCTWKESFMAATRELQRIYGTMDEGKQLS